MPSPLGLRSKTLATFFGLLAVTGLRLSEALGLNDGDVDLGAAVLHIKNAKNGKSRFVPVTSCTTRHLAAYRGERNRILTTPPTAFFVGEKGRRLSQRSAHYNFARIGQTVGLREKTVGEVPFGMRSSAA